MDKKRLVAIIIFILIFIISIIISHFYYNNKYSVYFETGTEEIILTKYVSKNNKVEEPIEPTKEGFIFKEWQIDGKTYDFNEKITKDIILTAKWIKEEYVTINFYESNKKLETIKMLKGEVIKDFPETYKEGYDFIGWFWNNKIYNNEKIYDDLKLVAQYKKQIINIPYKIGDKVKIIGKYSNSAYSMEAFNKRAIGWEREILYILEGSEFKYAVGNNLGVTGFFKLESIERID